MFIFRFLSFFCACLRWRRLLSGGIERARGDVTGSQWAREVVACPFQTGGVALLRSRWRPCKAHAGASGKQRHAPTDVTSRGEAHASTRQSYLVQTQLNSCQATSGGGCGGTLPYMEQPILSLKLSDVIYPFPSRTA